MHLYDECPNTSTGCRHGHAVFLPDEFPDVAALALTDNDNTNNSEANLVSAFTGTVGAAHRSANAAYPARPGGNSCACTRHRGAEYPDTEPNHGL